MVAVTFRYSLYNCSTAPAPQPRAARSDTASQRPRKQPEARRLAVHGMFWFAAGTVTKLWLAGLRECSVCCAMAAAAVLLWLWLIAPSLPLRRHSQTAESCADLVALLAALGITQTAVVAHGHAAATALQLAASQEGLVSQLVLLGATPPGELLGQLAAVAAPAAEGKAEFLEEEAVRGLHTSMLHEHKVGSNPGPWLCPAQVAVRVLTPHCRPWLAGSWTR